MRILDLLREKRRLLAKLKGREEVIRRLDKENARLRPAYVALASVLRCIQSHRETYGYEKPDYILDMLEREFQEAEAALAAGESNA